MYVYIVHENLLQSFVHNTGVGVTISKAPLRLSILICTACLSIALLTQTQLQKGSGVDVAGGKKYGMHWKWLCSTESESELFPKRKEQNPQSYVKTTKAKLNPTSL